jgi:Tannase and feruloyl esterase
MNASSQFQRSAAAAGVLCGAATASAQAPDCAALAAAAPPGVGLKADLMPGDSVRPPGVNAGPLLVAHCRVSGRMAERVGVDGKPYPIGFEMRLPQQWNGRLLYPGGGGNDGIIRPAVGPQAAPGYALNRGFAVVTTDAGHQGPTADFGFDPIARTDNAYHAHDKVAVTAKELLRCHHGKPAERAYFIGCSGGGRQAAGGRA